jgi:hypothetical protein
MGPWMLASTRGPIAHHAPLVLDSRSSRLRNAAWRLFIAIFCHQQLLPASPGRISVLRTISFAVGLTVGFVTAVDAQSGASSQRQHATADGVNRRLGELHVAPSAAASCATRIAFANGSMTKSRAELIPRSIHRRGNACHNISQRGAMPVQRRRLIAAALALIQLASGHDRLQRRQSALIATQGEDLHA